MALGKKDHSGHPLASGPGVTKKSFLAPILQSDPEIADLKKIINDLVIQVNAMQSKDNKSGSVVQERVPDQSIKASCSVEIFSSLPPGSTRCKLMLDNPKRVVASGLVIIAKPNEEQFLHTVPLDPSCKKVHVLTIVEGMELDEVPFPNELADVFHLKDARGNILAWPMDLIDVSMVSKEIKSKSSDPDSLKNKKIVNPTSSMRKMTTNISIYGATAGKPPLDEDTGTQDTTSRKLFVKLKFLSFYAKEVMIDSDIITINLPKEVVGYQIPIPITRDEIEKWDNQKEVELSHMSIFIKLMFDKTRKGGNDSVYQFICPHYMSPCNGHGDQDRMRHLSAALKRGNSESIFFVPYSVSEHWILCVIDPKYNTCYWFDPLRGPVRSDVKEIVEKGMKIFQATNGGSRQPRKPTKWDIIKCPRQPEGTIDCGYYVMRFMKEIMDNKQRTIPIEYLHGYNGRAYMQEEIDEIRELWAACIQKHLDSE